MLYVWLVGKCNGTCRRPCSGSACAAIGGWCPWTTPGNAQLEPAAARIGHAPRARLVNGWFTSSLASASYARPVPRIGPSYRNRGPLEEDAKRKALNEFIRAGGLFDGVADFDAATLDPQTGGMRAEFVPESTTGGPGEKIHPNRVGYLAMGMAMDLN